MSHQHDAAIRVFLKKINSSNQGIEPTGEKGYGLERLWLKRGLRQVTAALGWDEQITVSWPK
jgi:hypothetical protein